MDKLQLGKKDLIILDFDSTIYHNLSVFSTYKYSIPEINSIYRENSFLIEYWARKVEYINNLHNSNIFRSITIIDDDEVICTMLKNLQYTTIQAEIQHYGLDNHIKFHPFNQRNNLQLLEKEVMIHG